MGSLLDNFVNGLRSVKGGIVTTVTEMRENQFGIPLKHYAQQYLFGATGLRIQVFNSIQGVRETGKSTLLFELMGDVTADEQDGGEGGIAVIYEMEGKISPSILYSILTNHGPRAREAVILRLNMTLEQAMSDINKVVIPMYLKACPNRDKPIMFGMDSIGGSASEDTIEKLEKEGSTGKGYYNKQHFMKYFCENEGAILSRYSIPAVFVCINQEREEASSTPYGPPRKTITGGKAQLFKDGHMISASKKPLASKDGNLLTLRTTKTSFCDSRKIDVEFRWNKFGKKTDDAYEAHFDWALASARCLADPDKGVGEIREICDVKVSDDNNVTCPQLGLKSVRPEVFEAALMSNQELLDKLYTYQKIEKLRTISDYAEYLKTQKSAARPAKESADKSKESKEAKESGDPKEPKEPKSKTRTKSASRQEARQAAPLPLKLPQARQQGGEADA